MSSDASDTTMTDASGDTETDTHDTPQVMIPGLPDHLVVEHILRSEYFDDPVHLASLRAVSWVMHTAVAGTGLRFKECSEVEAAQLG
ncbi:hypothetical protein N9L76_02785 [bacterium]|nr:hypothetical protein [bacterium]|tara:strand:+ start:8145 stop:8405 length:261 start_codon:yes stop_codon:yes gene_type:complete